MMSGVVEEFGVEHGDIGDGLAVGGPCGLAVSAEICCDLSEMGAFVGVGGKDGPDVGVVGGVRVGRGAVAGEGEKFAVRGPGGLGVVEIAAGDLGEGFLGKIEDVEVGAAAVEVADFVEFELETVDDPGLFGFGLFVFGVVIRSA